MTSVRTSLLSLADFIGMNLDSKDLVFTGKASILTDWGLCQQEIKQSVFSSYHDEKTGITYLLLAQSGDLGLVIDYEPETQIVEVAVVDRSLIPDRGRGLWQSYCDRALEAIPEAAIKLTKVGPIKGKLETIL